MSVASQVCCEERKRYMRTTGAKRPARWKDQLNSQTQVSGLGAKLAKAARIAEEVSNILL